MKKIKLFVIALVAMCGFSACEKDCDHNFIEVDYSKALVGTWTCFQNGYAEALVINADGSAVSTGIEDGEYWEDVRGNIKTINNKMTMTFEDGDNWEGRFEMLSGEAFTIFEEDGETFTYRYCANDIAEEIVGMWVSTQEVFGQEEESVAINTYTEDGKAYLTAYMPEINGYLNQMESDYKVIGNLLIGCTKVSSDSPANYLAIELDIIPNGTELGDIMIHYNPIYEKTVSFVRIKQNLDLPGQKYDYIKTFVSNAKGEDKDIPFLNTSFNFAKMDGSIIDKFLKSTLFAVEFLNANEIKYSFMVDGKINPMIAPIEVEGNKMTIKMSANGPYQDVEIYTFQDQDNTQMHLYMHTSSFEKFFANTSVYVMLGNGQLQENDTEAIAGVYKTIADAVETINLSLVMSKSAKAN